MALTFTYIPVYPVTRRSQPKIRGRMLPENDGITQARTVGLGQDLKSYALRFIEKNADADTLDRFLRDHDNTGAWFYWTPPQSSQGAYRCRQWTRTEQNCVWSEVTATFDQISTPVNTDVCICPTIQGALIVGSTLSLSAINCGTGTATLSTVEWRRNGIAISGATNSTYITTSDDIAKNITAYVTYQTPLGDTASCTTAAVAIVDIPDEYFNYTSLLLHMDGANNSTTFTDSSIYSLAVTANGNAKISTTQSKFGGASGAFDGNGDFCTLAHNAQLNLSSGNFTIELWLYHTARPSSGQTQAVLDKDGVYNVSYPSYNIVINSSGSCIVYLGNGAGVSPTVTAYTIGTVPLTTWTHIAVVKNGSTITTYLNGVQGSSASQGVAITDGGKSLYLGYTNSSPSSAYFNGYIDELRITKGYARYTANFTPATGPFSNPAKDPNYASVGLLLHADGANSSTTFIDSSTNAITATLYGNVQISTAQSKFGGSSILFDGSGDYISYASSSDWTFGSSGDFTVEGWIYPNGSQATKAVVATNYTDYNTGYLNRWALVFTAGSTLSWLNSNGDVSISKTSFPLTVWTHIAVVRSGSTITFYVGGTSAGTQTTSMAYTTNEALKLGFVTNAAYFNGYIDEFRITKGVARYTTSFTPPALPFANK